MLFESSRKKLETHLMTSAFERLVDTVSLLPEEKRCCWGITDTECVATVVRSFEYYARICAAGNELPTAEGFRHFIIGRATAIARSQATRKKFERIDDLAIEDEKEAA